MAHHVSAPAKADLEDIWEYLYNQSGGSEVADRQIDAITHRFTCFPAGRVWVARETLI